MIELRKGEVTDFSSLSKLVFDSAPVLLPYLFSTEQFARRFLNLAMQKDDGQYSAMRHCVAIKHSKVVACITLWHSQMPAYFHTQTLASLREFLQPHEIQHLLSINPQLIDVFRAPEENQLCIGHLAVDPSCKGMGIGKKLIAYATRQAKNKGKNELILDVDSSNEEAISFYQGCDFLEYGTKTFVPTQQRFLRMVYKI